MGDDDEALCASDIQHLFHIKDYPRLKALVDEGKARARFFYRPDNADTWGTILGFAVACEDTRMFKYIMERCDWPDPLLPVSSDSLNVLGMMHSTLGRDHRLNTRRRVEVMCEIVLQKWGLLAYRTLRYYPHLRYLADMYRNSFDVQVVSITTVTWCLEAIRSASGATDGLGETVGKRMQAESAWEYEPKIKRTKY